jgi:hypothetical protein
MLTLLWPGAMHTFAADYQGPIDITESIIYAGFLTPIAALTGLVAAVTSMIRRHNNPLVPQGLAPVYWITLICLTFCFFYALGTHTVFYRALFHVLPGLKLFRRPVDALFLFTLLLCPMAALGMEAFKRAIATRTQAKAILWTASVLPILLMCWDLSAHALTPNRANSWPRAMISAVPDHFPAIAWLHANTANPGQPAWRVEFNQPAPFWPDLPAAEKIYSTQGYNPMQLSRYVDVFGTTPNGYAPVVFTRWTPNEQSPIFSLLGVKYVATSSTNDPHMAAGNHLKRAATIDGMTFWESDNRVPRLFSPSSVVAARADNSPALTAAVPDLSRRAVIEGPASAVAACGTTPLSAITLVHYANNHVSIDVTTGVSSGWLVMTDPATRGWHAYIDGREIPLYRTDSYFRGVCVPPGQHDVAFRFEPFRAIADTVLQHLHL